MERCLIHDAHSLPEAVAQVSQALASWEGLWTGAANGCFSRDWEKWECFALEAFQNSKASSECLSV